jgi:hypothetical protein
MRIAIQADDGDEVSIKADFVSVEQAIVTLEIENALYNSEAEIESVTLTLDRARELAKALLAVAEAIEFVSTPRDPLAGNCTNRRKPHGATPLRPRTSTRAKPLCPLIGQRWAEAPMAIPDRTWCERCRCCVLDKAAAW